MLIFVVVATSVLHGEFLRREKMELLDQQVRETATALLDSEIGDLRKIQFERVDALISEELGESRLGKFFVIRNNAGDVLFESTGAKLLRIADIPRNSRWVTLHHRGHYVRILNLDLPRINDRTLQVGVSIREELLSPRYFSRTNLVFTLVIFTLGVAAAWFLTFLLARPMLRLSDFLVSVARDPGARMELPELPKDLSRFSGRDEFAALLTALRHLISRVNRDYQVSRFWSYQMAHELKTPLTLIEAQVNEAQRVGKLDSELAAKILAELFEISETISTFLAWAEVENATTQKRLYVVRAERIVHDLERRLNAGFGPRLRVEVEGDFSIMCNIQHLEQAVGNLLTNALTYSEGDVLVKIEDGHIRISDHGSGIPETVMRRLGEPFNKGEMRRGNGLGLALVSSISRLYGWRLDFASTPKGTTVTLEFPELPQEQSSYPAGI